MKRDRLKSMVAVRGTLKRRGPGRPPKPAERKLSERVAIPVDQQTKEQLESLRALGEEPTEFARQSLIEALARRCAALAG